jgi:hypothetical protein
LRSTGANRPIQFEEDRLTQWVPPEISSLSQTRHQPFGECPFASPPGAIDTHAVVVGTASDM